MFESLDPGTVLQFDALFDQYRGWLRQVGLFALTLLGVYLVGRFLVIPPVVRAVDARNPNNETLVGAIRLYLRVLLVVVAVPVAVTVAGFGGVAVGSGVVVAAATLALGFAGQDIIGNFVSGVFLVADPDFNIGDYIEWADRSGTITDIDLRVTRMRTPSGEITVVPNTEIATSAVRHPYALDRYRVAETLVVSYEDDIEPVRAMLAEEAAADDRVAADPAPAVHVSQLGGGTVELRVWLWVADPRDVSIASVRTDFATRAKERLQREGVGIAPAGTQELFGELSIYHENAAG
jgi:small-conductance mechanosensitive channel